MVLQILKWKKLFIVKSKIFWVQIYHLFDSRKPLRVSFVLIVAVSLWTEHPIFHELIALIDPLFYLQLNYGNKMFSINIFFEAFFALFCKKKKWNCVFVFVLPYMKLPRFACFFSSKLPFSRIVSRMKESVCSTSLTESFEFCAVFCGVVGWDCKYKFAWKLGGNGKSTALAYWCCGWVLRCSFVSRSSSSLLWASGNAGFFVIGEAISSFAFIENETGPERKSQMFDMKKLLFMLFVHDFNELTDCLWRI